MSDHQQKNQPQTKANEEHPRHRDTSIPAVRHVGPTLESDPKYLELDTGSRMPETLIEQGIGIDDSNVRDIVSRGTDTADRPGQGAALKPGESLKTRLPGDTSSDPHTDVGSENTTTLQRKPDKKRNAA